jgi:hypothetical protein
LPGISIEITTDTATSLLEQLASNVQQVAATSLKFGAAASYALYVEFGTRKMHAQPFLRPALMASSGSLATAFLNACLQGNAEAVLAQVGLELEAIAQSIVPVRTGFLRSTIYSTVGAAPGVESIPYHRKGRGRHHR